MSMSGTPDDCYLTAKSLLLTLTTFPIWVRVSITPRNLCEVSLFYSCLKRPNHVPPIKAEPRPSNKGTSVLPH